MLSLTAIYITNQSNVEQLIGSIEMLQVLQSFLQVS